MFIKEFFTNNLPIKVLAIFSAIFLWTYVINEGYRVDFLDTEVPVEAYNISEDLALTSNLGQVKVKVRVPTSISNTSLLENTKVFIDLKGLRQGSYEKDIMVSFENPAVTLLELEPKKMKITLETLESIQKEIEVEISGEVNENYQTDQAILSVNQAEIKGAGSSLEKIEKLVAPINIANEMSEIKKLIELEARDANNKKITEVTIHPKNIEVIIPIRAKEEVKTVGIKANLSGNPAPGYFITQTSINPAVVSIKGETEVLSGISYLNTQAIDISGINANAEYDAQLELPAGVTQIEDQNIKITIQLDAQLITRTIDSVINFKNISSDLEINSYDPDSIKVIVEGGAPIINNLTSGGVVTNIDLAGKGAGSFIISIDPSMITLPSGVTLKSIETKDLKITLKK